MMDEIIGLKMQGLLVQSIVFVHRQALSASVMKSPLSPIDW